MAMEYYEGRKRAQGDEAAAAFARTMREQFGDVPLPSKESPDEIKRFSPEAREALEQEGYVIYGLSGQSIKTLREAGRRFDSTWHNAYPDFEALGSMRSAVAINPNKLFLPGSTKKTLAQQEEMVERYSKELARKVPGVRAIIGQAPDYVAVAFAHLDATKAKGEAEYLFGEKYELNCARTKTPISGSLIADVGSFDSYHGLDIRGLFAYKGASIVHAAPLVVPA
jgi:hypothetical protein